MNAVDRFTLVLRDPATFFGEHGDLATGRGAKLLVGAVAVLFGLAGYLFAGWVQPSFPASVVYVTLVTALGLWFVVLWGVTAAVAHAVSVPLGGSGDFDRTLRAVGWGFAPDLVVAPVYLALTFVATRGEGPTFETVDPLESIVGGDMSVLYQDPIAQVGLALLVLALAWKAVIWTYGLAWARALPVPQAAACVALPVLAALAVYAVDLL